MATNQFTQGLGGFLDSNYGYTNPLDYLFGQDKEKKKPATKVDPALGYNPDLLLKGQQRQQELKNTMATSIVDVKPETPSPLKTPSPWDFLMQSQAQSQEMLDRQKRRQAASSVTGSLANVVQSLFSAYGANQGAPISPVQNQRPQDQQRENALYNTEMALQQRDQAQKLQLILEDYQRKIADEQYQSRYGQQREDRLSDVEAQNSREDQRFKDVNKIEEERRNKLWERENELYKKKLEDIENQRKQGLIDKEQAAKFSTDENIRFQKALKTIYPDYRDARDYASSIRKPKIYLNDDRETVGLYEEDFGQVVDWIEDQYNNPKEVTTGRGRKAKTEYEYDIPELENVDLSTAYGREKAVRNHYKDFIKAQRGQTQQEAAQQSQQPLDAVTGESIPNTAPIKGTPSPALIELDNSMDNTMAGDVYRKTNDRDGRVELLYSIVQSKKKNIPEMTNISDDDIRKWVEDAVDEDLRTQQTTNPPASKK